MRDCVKAWTWVRISNPVVGGGLAHVGAGMVEKWSVWVRMKLRKTS